MKKWLLIAGCCGYLPFLSGQSDFAIRHVNIIDVVRDSILRDRTLLIGDGIIEHIGRAKNTRIPDGHQVIEGNGHYLLPGLINMYTHVNESNLMLYLANGQTTVRDIPSHLNVLGLREQVKEHKRAGPRILSYGLRVTGAPAPFHSQQPIFTAGQGREQVREAKRLGYDGLMIYATCPPHAYAEILDEAEKIDLPVSGHFPICIDENEVLQSKQREFDNLTGLTRGGELRFDRAQLLLQLKEHNKAITPSLAVHKLWSLAHLEDSIFRSPLMEYIPSKLSATWKPDGDRLRNNPPYPYERVAAFVKELSDRGIQLFLGSDGGYPLVVPGFAFLDEMELFVNAGISIPKVLRYATVDAARFLGLENSGTIEVGKRADLLLLSENPLTDIRHMRKIAGVMTEGQWWSQSYLQQELSNLKNQLRSRDHRFQAWDGYLPVEGQGPHLNYTFYTGEYPVGQHKTWIDTLANGIVTLRSAMVADGPDFRETYSFHRIRNRRTDSLFLVNRGSEGETKVAVSLKNDTATIRGFSPFHGPFEYKKFAPVGTQFWCPFISRYFELDNPVNYYLALTLAGNIDIDEANQIKVLQIELNSEEFGEKYILDESVATIYRTGEREYRLIYPGFSGFPNRTSLPFNLRITTGQHTIPLNIQYLDHQIQLHEKE